MFFADIEVFRKKPILIVSLDHYYGSYVGLQRDHLLPFSNICLNSGGSDVTLLFKMRLIKPL